MNARTIKGPPKARKAPSARAIKAQTTRIANRTREALSFAAFTFARDPDGVDITVNNLETVNELNVRNRSTKAAQLAIAAARAKQRERIGIALMGARTHMPKGTPARAHFVRLATGTLDELTNLPSALKRTEDSVCEFFKVDDGPSCPIRRSCSQEVRRVPGVRIELRWTLRPQDKPRCRQEHPGLRVSCCLAFDHKTAHASDDGEVLW